MVLGETEITGQVKNAYEASRMARLTGKTLNRTFQKALQTAKQIHTRTGIGRGATSVGSVSVMQAMRLFGEGLSRKTAMVIGAGQMAEACVRHLFDKGVTSIVVANRSFDKAEELAGKFSGRAVHFDHCLQAMIDADIVISSTGCPLQILDREDIAQVMDQRPDRPLFMIDIAVPRDIDPAVGDLPGVALYDIDNLEEAIRENVSHREQDLALCRSIIERKVALLTRPRESQHLKQQVIAG
jgi:glutamyl-tRNA reductase